MQLQKYDIEQLLLLSVLTEWLFLQDEETETLLQTEFEIGQFLRERVIPRAVLYFTGEALEDDVSF